MEARSVEVIPEGPEWQYEPKWDGFRCILARNRNDVHLGSKSGQDLTRYFPELVEAARKIEVSPYTLDGEIVVPAGRNFSFDNLLQRIHPAISRVKKMAVENPAHFIAFDLLEQGRTSLTGRTLAERRAELERFARAFKGHPQLRLSICTLSRATALKWLAQAGGGMDGVIAKRRDLAYVGGTRDGMQKIKKYRSADCVVGGFRYAENLLKGRQVIGSLLLGLYDDNGLLHHVGFSSAIKAVEKRPLTQQLSSLIAEQSFTGNTPGGPSRWSTKRSSEWVPVKPELVVEVSYDHFTGGRFRHGTSILRWRPDKKANQCHMDQLKQKTVDLNKLLK